MRLRRETATLALLATAALAGLIVVPLARMGWTVLVEDHASLGRVVSAPGFGHALAHSLELAIAVPLLAVPLGAAAALLLRAGQKLPCRRFLQVLMVLPLVVPQFVLGYSWTQAYGRAGFTDDLLGVHWSGVDGGSGVLAVLVVDAVPLSGDSTLEDGNWALLYAVNAANVTIEGPGTIDGQGIQFHAPVRGAAPPSGLGGPRRPYHLLLYRCEKLRVISCERAGFR